LGDLREGIMPDDALQMVGKIRKLPGVKIIGIGANFCCISGVMPTRRNLAKLVELTEEIKNNFYINLEVISGGNTSVLKLVEDDIIPNRINHCRSYRSTREAIFTPRGDWSGCFWGDTCFSGFRNKKKSHFSNRETGHLSQ